MPILKDGSYFEDEALAAPERQVDITAWLEDCLRHAGWPGSRWRVCRPTASRPLRSRTKALLRAVYSGLPVVFCGRGNTEGFAVPMSPFIAGANLAVTKARMLLMACLMKFGALPAAADPLHPTAVEAAATANGWRRIRRCSIPTDSGDL